MVIVTFNSYEKGIITRRCVPFDYGPSVRSASKEDKYHFYDLDSPDGKHNLSVKPSQIIEIALSNEIFNPKYYITWSSIHWCIKRDWGSCS